MKQCEQYVPNTLLKPCMVALAKGRTYSETEVSDILWISWQMYAFSKHLLQMRVFWIHKLVNIHKTGSSVTHVNILLVLLIWCQTHIGLSFLHWQLVFFHCLVYWVQGKLLPEELKKIMTINWCCVKTKQMHKFAVLYFLYFLCMFCVCWFFWILCCFFYYAKGGQL